MTSLNLILFPFSREAFRIFLHSINVHSFVLKMPDFVKIFLRVSVMVNVIFGKNLKVLIKVISENFQTYKKLGRKL